MNNDTFVFKETLSDLSNNAYPEPVRDLETELFGKKGLKEKLDALESTLGYGKENTTPKIKFHNKIFCPNSEDDRKLLNELLNDPRFSVVKWEDTWTAHGDYRVFIIYSENLEVKKAKKDEDDDE